MNERIALALFVCFSVIVAVLIVRRVWRRGRTKITVVDHDGHSLPPSSDNGVR